MRRTSRTTTVTAATAGALVLLAGPASAHFCTNTARSDVANAALAKGSKGWVVLSRDIGLFLPDLCQAGQDHVLAAFEAAGGDADMPILAHAVLAGGVQDQVDAGTKDGLPRPITNTDVAALEALGAAIPVASGMCGG